MGANRAAECCCPSLLLRSWSAHVLTMHFSDFPFCTRMKKAEQVLCTSFSFFPLQCCPTRVKALPFERASSRLYTNTDERSCLPHRRKRLSSPLLLPILYTDSFFSPAQKRLQLHVTPNAPMNLQPRDAALRQTRALRVFIHNDK